MEFSKLLSKPVSLIFLVFIISMSTAQPKSKSNHTTTTTHHEFELISRDALLHHGANNKLSRKDLTMARLDRSRQRVEAISSAHSAAAAAGTDQSQQQGSNYSTLYSGQHWGVYEYFVRLGVGTPPRDFYMGIDTGSGLVWIQCLPCKNCYDQVDPIFDPSKSSTFSPVPCDEHGSCLYSVSYGDGSSTKGQLSIDTLTFGNTTVEEFALGCGHDNGGHFVAAAGLLGLDQDPLSFPMQTLDPFEGIFSYCLNDVFAYPPSNTSSLMFGRSSLLKEAAANYTPMLDGTSGRFHYYVNLTGISVGSERVPGVTFSVFSDGGGVIIDSGTSITYLIEPAYVALRDAYRKASNWNSDYEGSSTVLDTCYMIWDAPKTAVTLHFDGGADMVLPVANVLLKVDFFTTCFAFAASNDISIIGSIQQTGFRVSFDLQNQRVGFTPNGCTT